MNPEALVAAGYAGALILAAFVLEWLSAHTHRRSLRYRTAGFTYDQELDHWECPQGERLWPHEYDHQRRLVRYRANAHVCNLCPVKDACTDSDRGREIIRPLDPWPHSEAGRFHRVIAVLMVALGAVPVVVRLVVGEARGAVAQRAAVRVRGEPLEHERGEHEQRCVAGGEDDLGRHVNRAAVASSSPGSVTPDSSVKRMSSGSSSVTRFTVWRTPR